jgi:geranylgeranyl diphosphate synthase type II
VIDPVIDEVLDDYGAVTRATMAAYLPSFKPNGYLYDLVADYPMRGGKMMRPSICIATARAFGAEIEDAVRIAVSIELLHNALLIHDDIEDESETRRGGPTLHRKHGLPLALNAGDALALASLRPLIHAIPQIGPWMSLQLIEELERMARETAEGQAIELGWRRENRVDLAPEDYLVMVLKKTCWLATIYPCRAGALVGLRRSLPENAFVNFGFFVGSAFQIIDDVLNIEADDRYGKEICGDLLEGKRTLMLIDLLHRLMGPDHRRLMRILDTPRERIDPEDVIWMRRQIISHGALERARAAAHGMAGAAAHEFQVLFGDLPDSRDKRFLGALAGWTLARAS